MAREPRIDTALDQRQPHQAREMAESFGTDPARYDRARPAYPQALIDALVAAAPGPDVLDVGIGTGICARAFRQAGCRVLGVDVDERMSEFARHDGFEVQTASFETWDAGGRLVDLVVSGQAWHWVEPVVGATRAAEVLRRGGLLAAFWNVLLPASEVSKAFAEVHRRVLPDSPRNPWTSSTIEGYAALFEGASNGIRQTGVFSEPEQWRYDWERSYTRDEWLDQLATTGETGRLPAARRDELLAKTATAVDMLGGYFRMRYAAVAVVARRSARG